LGGATVEVDSSGTARPSTLTQVTIRLMSLGQSCGFQPTLTNISSPDGPSPTTWPSAGPLSPNVDRHRAAADPSFSPAPAPAAVSGTSPVTSAPSVS
jgi:hypothetical protein